MKSFSQMFTPPFFGRRTVFAKSKARGDWFLHERWIRCGAMFLLFFVGLAADFTRNPGPTCDVFATPAPHQDSSNNAGNNAEPENKEQADSQQDEANPAAGDAAENTAGDAAQPAVESNPAPKAAPSSSPPSADDLSRLKAAGPFQRPFILEIKGEIDHTTLKYVKSGVLQAQAAKADLLVVEIDSPGGGAVESMEIADLLAQSTWATTVALVPREATSGGALIALGCQHIVLQPGATIGDIGVIQLDMTMMAFRYAPAKVRSILVAKARALCERHGRPADLAEAMVDEYAVVYRNENDPNAFKLVSMGTPDQENRDDDVALEAGAVEGVVAKENLPGGWVLIPETRPGRFLTLTNRRAVEVGIAQATVNDLQDLEQKIGVQGNWQRRSYGLTDSIVDFLNGFWITGLLLIVGIVALFIEISAPGISVGGLVALLCFSLFFWSHFAGGTAGWLEVILFLLGVVFLLAEFFVIPGFGVAGIMGIGLIVIALVMACLDFLYPTTDGQWREMGLSVVTVMTAGMFGVIGVVLMLQYIGNIPALNRLALAPPTFEENSDTKKKADNEGQAMVATSGRAAGLKVGDEGITESVLRPAGRARIAGRSIDVVADGKFIEAGLAVKIMEIRGNRIIVVQMGQNHHV